MKEYLDRSAAMKLVGAHSNRFGRLARLGAFKRKNYVYEASTLRDNYAIADQIDRDAEARMAEIRAEADRRIAALGTPGPLTLRESER